MLRYPFNIRLYSKSVHFYGLLVRQVHQKTGLIWKTSHCNNKNTCLPLNRATRHSFIDSANWCWAKAVSTLIDRLSDCLSSHPPQQYADRNISKQCSSRPTLMWLMFTCSLTLIASCWANVQLTLVSARSELSAPLAGDCFLLMFHFKQDLVELWLLEQTTKWNLCTIFPTHTALVLLTADQS